LQVILIFSAIFNLPTLWKIYPNLREAREAILSLGFSLGERTLTLGMFLQAALFFYISHLVAFLLCTILQGEVYPRKQIDLGVANSINSLLRYALWILGVVFAFFALGFELQQLAIIAGALSVGIGFGLQNIVNNFVSGIILLFERPVKVGDLLEIQNEWGEVEKVGLRSTIIRTHSKTQLIIPNSDFITQKVTNLTFSDKDYRVEVPVGITYGSNVELAKNIMEEIASKHPLVSPKRKPKVIFQAFGNSSLDFEIFVWVSDAAQKRFIISDILFEVEKQFRQNNIEIPFPQRDLHVRSIDQGLITRLKN
ncbi:MAG: mechanosensitive ion channel, partial [Deltaproteobacteria bacterium]|nr:mechanosensitive ion channel [Deltaproteobacteria bacterium]